MHGQSETSRQTRSNDQTTDRSLCGVSLTSPVYDVTALSSPYIFQHAFEHLFICASELSVFDFSSRLEFFRTNKLI
ncbi:hypothetical protein WN943_011293 [Citrus x changshan-huyou]